MAQSVRWTGNPSNGYLQDETGRRLRSDDLGLLPQDRRLAPTDTIAETMPRSNTPLANTAALTSGTVRLDAIQLQEGDVVTSISYLSATTALDTATVQLFGLYDKNLARLAQSADATSAAWAANTVKTLTMATPYTVLTDDYYYLAILVAASTVPTLAAITYNNAIASSTAPILSATSDTSATALAATAAALTGIATRAYAYVK